MARQKKADSKKISDRKTSEQLKELTGVLGRAELVQKIDEIIKENRNSVHTLLALEIDGLKLLEDMYGNLPGEEPVDVAGALHSALRHEDLLGRISGNEFLICLKDIPYDAAVKKRVEQICAVVRKAFSFDVQITTRIGIAVYPRDGENFDVLFHNANEALRNTKKSEKDEYAFFDSENGANRSGGKGLLSDESGYVSSETSGKRQMLIVSDDIVNRGLIAKIFKDEFFVNTVADGHTAMIRLRHYGNAVSIVIIDLNIQYMDGLTVLKKMQENSEMRTIPVIIASPLEDRETSLNMIKQGAADFVGKPIDPDLLKIRVQAAISKAENERLRAQNSYLVLQSNEETKYRTVLESTGTVVIEYDWTNGVFIYDPSISKHIAGKYDSRKLWRILMSDMIADAMDVKEMQELVHSIANDRDRTDGKMIVKLKTPSGKKQWFSMRVFKNADEFQLTNKMIITYVNINEEVLAEEELRFQAEHDSLTGLFSREVFFEKAAEMIASAPEKYYVMSCFNVNNFKMINDQYGNETGDTILKHIANVFKKGCEDIGGICCRIMADNFAVLFPSKSMTSQVVEKIREDVLDYDESLPRISFNIGRYIVADRTLPVSTLYERAAMAEASIKGRVDVGIVQYDEAMRTSLLHQQEIIDEMDTALRNKQFEVWLQPQYNHSSGALIGAEALVRWRHPKKGLILPGDFIPIFERNGFIYEMDKYVWEQTCSIQRKWIDSGRKPLPVSVNISRYDIFREDLIKVITGLVKKYEIPVELLRLEITESAFAESSDQIISVVKSLIDHGFTVEIDDFGSGYSSLNTLKDVPAQILKLDMRFLENYARVSEDSSEMGSSRGGNILESIVRMSKWLGMSVIAEGVETVEQADFLKSIGCSYVQGYLYSKPMPLEEYKKLTESVEKQKNLAALQTVVNLDNNAFWDPASMDTLIFNSYVGGACIFEYQNGKIELLRATEKYTQVIGSETMTIADALKMDWRAHLDEETLSFLASAVKESSETQDEISGEFVFNNLPGCPEKTYLHCTMRVIAKTGDRQLVYCINENITAQREAEKKERELNLRIQAIMDNINGGVSAVTFDEEGIVNFVFANDNYYSILGYTREQFKEEVSNAFDLLHPDDVDAIRKTVIGVIESREPAVYEYRCYKRGGEIVYLRCNAAITAMEGIGEKVLLSVISDITTEKESEMQIQSLNMDIQRMMDDMPGGFVRLRVLSGGHVELQYANEPYCRLRGLTREEIMENYQKDAMAGIHPDDEASVKEAVREMIETGQSGNMKYRMKHASGGYATFSVFGRVTKDVDGRPVINAYYTAEDEN